MGEALEQYLQMRNYYEKFNQHQAEKETQMLSRQPSKKFIIDKELYNPDMMYKKQRDFDLKRMKGW